MLGENYELEFNHLFTITNLPIGRFAQDLKRNDKLDQYIHLLEDNYNDEAAKNIMCRSQVSVGYDGLLYDCDFNQMMDMKAKGPKTINELLERETLDEKLILEIIATDAQQEQDLAVEERLFKESVEDGFMFT